jgi:hypothetical protein
MGVPFEQICCSQMLVVHCTVRVQGVPTSVLGAHVPDIAAVVLHQRMGAEGTLYFTSPSGGLIAVGDLP